MCSLKGAVDNFHSDRFPLPNPSFRVCDEGSGLGYNLSVSSERQESLFQMFFDNSKFCEFPSRNSYYLYHLLPLSLFCRLKASDWRQADCNRFVCRRSRGHSHRSPEEKLRTLRDSAAREFSGVMKQDHRCAGVGRLSTGVKGHSALSLTLCWRVSYSSLGYNCY